MPGGVSPPPDGRFVVDVTAATFEEAVIKSPVPVILDCWAPWCGPCKQLTPLLERLVENAGGSLKLAKVNVDEEKQLAGALRVQSIPAVFGVVKGRVVDSFVGAVPPDRMQVFVEKLAAAAGEGGDDKSGFAAPVKAAAGMLEAIMRTLTGRTAAEGFPVKAWLRAASEAGGDKSFTVPDDLPPATPATAAAATAALSDVASLCKAIADTVGSQLTAAEEPSPEDVAAGASAVETLVRVRLANGEADQAAADLEEYRAVLQEAAKRDASAAETSTKLETAVAALAEAEAASGKLIELKDAAEASGASGEELKAYASALTALDRPGDAFSFVLSVVRAAHDAGQTDKMSEARTVLFELFETIGQAHPETKSARRELARILL